MRRLIAQISLPLAGVAVVGALLGARSGARLFGELHREALSNRLERDARLIAAQLPPGSGPGPTSDARCVHLAALLGARVTMIAGDGRVLGDSAMPSAAMDPMDREAEILAARGSGRGVAIRSSSGEPVLSVAVAEEVGGERRFVRLSVPLHDLSVVDAWVQRMTLYALLGALALGGGAGWLATRAVRGRIRGIERKTREIVEGGSPAVELDDAEPEEVVAVERKIVDLVRAQADHFVEADGKRSKLEVVLRSMLDGVVVLDSEGKIQLSNASARSLLNLPPRTDVSGTELALLCRHPDVLDLADEVLGAASGTSLQREIVFSTENRPRTISVSGSPLSAEEHPRGAILVFHDMTRVRQLETVRADFVANVSHELRTPLTAIRGYAETLLNGAIDDRERALQFLRVIDRHSRRLARLIDDLLSLSDLELGRTELHRYPVALPSLIEAIFEMLEQQARACNVSLEADISENVPRPLADRDRLEEVLINLVENAIKYSGRETPVVVRAREIVGDDGKRAVEIAVIDHGVGIPEHDIPRLTERFYRVDRARSRELGGTGLGLAIVKHIVQAHEGRLRIESEINVGTTVTLVLPAAEEVG